MATKTTSDVTYTLCTTPTDVFSAIRTLSQYPYVMLDCEGREIGTTDGALSLLCLGTPAIEFQSIFVIDIPAIRAYAQAMRAIASFLCSPHLVKVVWDGRMDAIELMEAFGVGLEQVLDLQIAEVLARDAQLGETDYHRMERLATGQFGFRAVKGNQALFAGMHMVLGMQKCLEWFKLDLGMAKDTEVVQMHRNHQSSRWMERPLSPRLLQYAANDISLIAHLFAFFSNNSFVPASASQFNAMLDMSMRYVSRCGKLGRIHERDPFRPKGVLLMDSLIPPEHSIFAECVGCGIVMPLSCFGTVPRARKAYCRLCEVRAMKENLPMMGYWLPMGWSPT